VATFAAAEQAANRIIKQMDTQFEDLKNKAAGLEQQLTDISRRVTQLSEQLKGIEQAVSAIKDKVGK